MTIIPMYSYPDYSEDLLIGDVVYTFSFTWNTKGKFWAMSISLFDEPIVLGIKLVLSFEVYNRFSYLSDTLKGYMYVAPLRDDVSTISEESFVNGDCSLVYVGVNDAAV